MFVKTILIKGAPITLAQLLKKIDIIASGGEAKAFLSEEKVLVNQQPENRRGRKLVDGDIIEIRGNQYRLVDE